MHMCSAKCVYMYTCIRRRQHLDQNLMNLVKPALAPANTTLQLMWALPLTRQLVLPINVGAVPPVNALRGAWGPDIVVEDEQALNGLDCTQILSQAINAIIPADVPLDAASVVPIARAGLSGS